MFQAERRCANAISRSCLHLPIVFCAVNLHVQLRGRQYLRTTATKAFGKLHCEAQSSQNKIEHNTILVIGGIAKRCQESAVEPMWCRQDSGGIKQSESRFTSWLLEGLLGQQRTC